MLTATDIHLLVGFLTVASSPDDVEIELGSMIYDEAAEEKRDVDVTTLLRRPDGGIEAFSGIEVKKETRPLGVQEVEELGAKLLDMPTLSRRAIVSASGFRRPAIRKAAAHGIELWHLRPWEQAIAGAHSQVRESRLEWKDGWQVRFNPDENVSASIREAFASHPPKEAFANILRHIEENVRKHHLDEFPIGTPVSVNLHCTLTNSVMVQIPGEGDFVIRSALVSGVLTHVVAECPVTMKALVRDGDLTPYAACILAELNEGHLIGCYIGQRSANIGAVSVSLRNRQVLRRLRLR